MARHAVLLTVVALILAGLGAAGWSAWKTTSAAQGRRPSSSTITLEVVPPTEPDLPSTGSVLAVGELQDGYEHDPERLAGSTEDPEPGVENAWLELRPEAAAPDDVEPSALMAPSVASPSQAVPHLDSEDYSFGFDAPQPDHEAGRRARQSVTQQDSLVY